MFDSGHQGGSLAYIFKSRCPKINSVRPIDNIKTNFKFEGDWGNIFKDIPFTSIYTF